MSKPLMYDLYCKAGGATKGYQNAGFRVIGVDIEPQPNYIGDGFIQMDALEFLRRYLAGEYEKAHAFHASPPCQKYTKMQHIHKNGNSHPDLIDPTRRALDTIGVPWVIENVEESPLRVDLMLCGTMFGIPFPKHRWFETNFPISTLLPPCNHYKAYDPFHGGEDARGEREKVSKLFRIDWFMTREEVRNAIPPAYTEFIGHQLMQVLEASCTPL